MAFDPSRLYTLLLNTGLQQKDNPLHQVIHGLIDHTISTNKQVNTIISGGGSVGPQGIQGIQGVAGLAGESGDSFTEEISFIPRSILDLNSPFSLGDILVGNLSGGITSIPDVAINSLLISKGVGVIPTWSDNVNLGTTGSGLLNISGRIAISKTLVDDGVLIVGATAIFPSVITANRTAFAFSATTAGSSAFGQSGLSFILNAGYTGSVQTVAFKTLTNVATALNQAVAHEAQAVGAGLSNCAIAGVANNGTNGNIGVYGGIGGFTEGNFNFNITSNIINQRIIILKIMYFICFFYENFSSFGSFF